jgi:molybdate transport system substrate-binding protein
MKNYPTTWVNVAIATARRAMAAAAAAVIGLLPVHALHAEQVLVAVAANFSAPMAELAQRFSGQTGHEVVLTQGASGRFVAQISNGAPFQVFLSADQDKPRALDELGLTVPDTQFTYAVGALLLWSADPERILDSPDALLDSGVRRIALANPRLAPYGRAAMETLTSLSLLEATRDRWVQGENIAQVFQFVESGNAQLGFVAKSQVAARGDSALARAWSVPAQQHTPIRQDAVLLKAGSGCQACRELLAYLRSDEAAMLIRDFGYELP